MVLLNCVVVLTSLVMVGKEVRDRWHEQRRHKGLHINEADEEVKVSMFSVLDAGGLFYDCTHRPLM